MSLFPRNFYDDGDVSFAPVFRFIDAFDNWNTNTKGSKSGQSTIRATFNPKFDVVETKNSYELHGEIPGVERKDISIEFTEPQTIVIHGRTERKYTSGTPPAGLVEGQNTAGAITEGSEKEAIKEKEAPRSPSPHKATVSDEEDEAAKERGTRNDQQQQITQAAATSAPAVQRPTASQKYWVQERSIGEFHRTFSFPIRVDENAVKASLDNGILHVTIPKQDKRASRRIDIA